MVVNFLPVCQTIKSHALTSSIHAQHCYYYMHAKQRKKAMKTKKEKKKCTLHTNYGNYVKRAATILPQYYFFARLPVCQCEDNVHKIGVCPLYNIIPGQNFKKG